MSRRVAAVYFDCDSTLSRIEGIEELARVSGAQVRSHIVRLTNDAMDGRTPLEDVYGERLHATRPSRSDLARIGARYVETRVEGAQEVFAELSRRGIVTGIVSGGLRPAVHVIAESLGVPHDRVHAVDVRFDETGAYAGFDEQSPLARAGGKIEVLGRSGFAPRPLAFVGDGVTDLETKDVVDVFVGYGGVVRRDRVAAQAAYYLEGEDLRALLDLPPFR